MRYNKLGKTGLFLSELCFGTMTFGATGAYQSMGTVGQEEANDLVAHAFEAGINLFDTADRYSEGESERITGKAIKALKAPREEILIATKVFGAMSSGPNGGGSSRAHIMDGVKASLRRLDVDHIDLYQLHGFDPATPIEESLRALDDLVRQGHVRYIGVSNWASWQIMKALGISERLGLARFDSLQAYYSVAGRDVEREIVPMLQGEGVGLLVWSPLAGGFLSGKYGRGMENPEGSRRSATAFPPVNEARAFDAIDAMRVIANEKNVSVAQIALAWLLHQKAVTSVILGTRRKEQLDDNLGATKIVLSAAERKTIDDVSFLPLEYSGWMFDVWSAGRAKLLAAEANR